jgi:hypothetical protein
MSNIDSLTPIDTHDRFKIACLRIRLLLSSTPKSDFFNSLLGLPPTQRGGRA